MKKILTLLFVLLLACGCSSQQPAQDAQEGTSVLRIGMECDYAPFNWTQSSDSDTAVPISSVDFADGYDVVIGSMIAEKLGMEVQVVKTDWDSLIPSLNAGAIDCIIAGMTETPERAEAVSFTTPYYESQMVVIVRKDSDLVNITNIQELSGRNVLGQINTTYDEIIDQIEGVNHMTPLDTYPRMVLSLQAKEADAITAELPVANGVVAANPDLAIVSFAEGNGFVVDTSVSIAVAKENEALLNDIQAALDSISEADRLSIMEAAVNRQPAIEG
ncbi:MAG: transporter substrate-binding domain-containing protein [Erysipelotrichaceae bacterium]|nr:transporter substrate-binding domain-containing protein [Erysipelotrichaceae bacterium]MBR6232839.1 transporter substrate-binding domain-containing protein [Erysipelotrichaceae bacterium]